MLGIWNYLEDNKEISQLLRGERQDQMCHFKKRTAWPMVIVVEGGVVGDLCQGGWYKEAVVLIC